VNLAKYNKIISHQFLRTKSLHW